MGTARASLVNFSEVSVECQESEQANTELPLAITTGCKSTDFKRLSTNHSGQNSGAYPENSTDHSFRPGVLVTDRSCEAALVKRSCFSLIRELPRRHVRYHCEERQRRSDLMGAVPE